MRDKVRGLFLHVAAVALALVGCHGSSATKADAGIPKGARVLRYDYAGGRNVRVLAFDGGLACQADGVVGPMTYDAADAGKASTRKLTQSEADVLRKIRRYVHSGTLRFTWLGSQFIVYDAIYGVCNGTVYWVMNGGCNEFYSSTDTWMEHTVPGSPGWPCTPPPWDKH